MVRATSWHGQATTDHVVMTVISVAVSLSSITSRMCYLSDYKQAVSAKGISLDYMETISVKGISNKCSKDAV